MRAAIVLAVAGLIAGSPAALRADVGIGAGRPEPAPSGLSISVFALRGDANVAASLAGEERLSLRGDRVDFGAASAPFAQAPGPGAGTGASWSRKNTAMAVLASAILPGMGELYCYRTNRDRGTLARVPVFVALDAFMWYETFHNHDVGKDYKRQYEQYADAHWDLNRFLQNHPCCIGYGGCDNWQYFNSHCQGQLNYFFYTPREMDREEYYENIGKYNAFVFGWDDAAPWDLNNPNQANEYQYWTPHRTAYWDLRKQSDKYLLRSDEYLMGLIVSRVVSMVDAAWIAHRISSGQDPDKGWSLRFRTYETQPTLLISRRF